MKRAIRIGILVGGDQSEWRCWWPLGQGVVCGDAFGLVHGQLVMGKGEDHRHEEGHDEGTLI